MRKFRRWLSVMLICCMLAPATAYAAVQLPAIQQAETGFTQEELTEISSSLRVPGSLQVEITQGEPYYWDAGERWLIQVSIYYQGELVAGAAVDASTGELVRNILTYSGPPVDDEGDVVEGEFHFYINVSSQCMIVGSTATLYAGLFVNDALDPQAHAGSYTISVSDSSLLHAAPAGWNAALGQAYTLNALQPGTVTVTIRDAARNATGSLVLHLVEAESAYTFDSVPEMQIESGKVTNFYDYSGLVVDDFQYTTRYGTDGAVDHYDVTMTVYNTLDLYGAVTAYDADGNVYDYTVIDKKKSLDSSFTESVKSLFLETGDLFHLLGNDQYYSGESISQKTDVSIEVPQGGYLEISNHPQSVVALIANTTGLMVDFILASGDLALDIDKTLDRKLIAEQVLAEALQKNDLSNTLVSAAKDTVKSELMSGNWKQIDLHNALEHISSAMTDAGYNLLQNITKKIASVSGLASLTESVALRVIPTGHLIDLLYSGSDVLEMLVSTVIFVNSAARPTGILLLPSGFTDVSTDAYYYDAVNWAVENGITAGTSDSTFSPDSSCTRAQAVTFLWRAAGSPEPAQLGNTFTDVSQDAYYSDAVRWAVEEGITAGTSEHAFSPNAVCSRAQIVTFLYRYAGSPDAGSGGFADVGQDSYYADAVSWAVHEQITSGTGPDTFSPASDCTRGQIVTFLYRSETGSGS